MSFFSQFLINLLSKNGRMKNCVLYRAKRVVRDQELKTDTLTTIYRGEPVVYRIVQIPVAEAVDTTRYRAVRTAFQVLIGDDFIGLVLGCEILGENTYDYALFWP